MMEERNIKTEKESFVYSVDQFMDMKILRYRLPHFEELTLKQKILIYYLSEAARAGRDILWDQNYRHNLLIRRTLESILENYNGDRENNEYAAFLIYAKRVFFANGIHHHYSGDKMQPGFSESFFFRLLNSLPAEKLPVDDITDAEPFKKFIASQLFDEKISARKVERAHGTDIVKSSAVNFYYDVSQNEVEEFYKKKANPDDSRPLSHGLNSRLIKKNNLIEEEVYRSGGLYGKAIDVITEWLQKAIDFAESESQAHEIELLIKYYKTGDLSLWDSYNVLWAQNTSSVVDYNNGFIEVYNDPLGIKATWEAIVNYADIDASRRTRLITDNSQWFEDHSPVDKKYRKEEVKGVSAKVINIAMLGGDCYPASPLGINLPNADWIRKEVGSKSVTLANISEAHDITSMENGFLEEFSSGISETERIKKYGSLADSIHTDLHECIGHASGKLAPGTDPNALKSYYSTLEEARADLFALYFIIDPKLAELGILPGKEAAMASYDAYIRNGLLTQIVRIQPGKDIEEAHMRNRALIARWVYEQGKADNVISIFVRDNKTYVKINDYDSLRTLFGRLLAEVQRIKSEGDYTAGKDLVENYGVKVDPALHKEILERYRKLNLAPYTGFLNPELTPVYDTNGEISDIRVEYQHDYLAQMTGYGKRYSYLDAIFGKGYSEL